MRFAPARCRRRQIAAPTRLAPPVINTTFPSTSAPALDSGPPRKSSTTNVRMRPSRPPALPEPDPDARAHSARVADAARREIAEAGGWISFARYMQHVLYAPGLGYYVAGARKFGADGDFVTAPELTPLFAQALAVQVAAILAVTATREIVEFGAGSGILAADLLDALAKLDALPSRYAILDISPDLRERQRATIARRAPQHLDRVVWLDALPESIDGAVL